MNIKRLAEEERARRAASEDIEPLVYVGEERPPMTPEHKRQLRAALAEHGVSQIRIVRVKREQNGS